ncbi:MAG: hypothetical protein IT427_07660 [Pirellulales bacterium]|nr:hypothetical protein [Pirellulales bacterium]
MDALILDQAEELAKSLAGKAATIVELNGVIQTVMKSALERMLGAELSVPLSEQPAATGICRSVEVGIELPNFGPPAAAKPGLGLGGILEH